LFWEFETLILTVSEVIIWIESPIF
jgi:hypothetical protein